MGYLEQKALPLVDKFNSMANRLHHLKIFALLLIWFNCQQLTAQTFHDSIPFYQEKFTQHLQNNDQEAAIVAARKIIRGYGVQFPDSAFYWANQAYQLALQTENSEIIIERLIALGRFTFLKQEYEKAVLWFEKADSLTQLHPHEKVNAGLLFSLAEGYEYTARPELSMQTYERCYALAEQMQDKYYLCKLDIKMGNLSRMDKQFDSALNYFKKAFTRGNKDNADTKRLYYTARINYTSIPLSNPEEFSVEQKAYFARVIDTIYQNFLADEEMRRFLPTVELQRIEYGLVNQDNDLLQSVSLTPIETIKKRSSNAEYLHHQFGVHFHVALAQNKPTAAKVYLDASEKLVSNYKNIAQRLNFLRNQKEWLVFTKNYEKALNIAEEIHLASDSLNNKERLENIDNLQGQIAAQQKEAEIKLLNKDKEFLANRNLFFTISTLIFAGLFGLIALLFFQSKSKNKIISQQNAQLESLNLTKDRIFAVLGHDLRKPAISFRGITEKLRYLIEQKDFKTMEQLGGVLEKNAFALNKLTDNLLNWALTQKEALTYQPKAIRVAEMTEEVLDLFQNVAADKNITLTTDIPADLTLFADANSFLIIIRNLLDNAIKFTPTGGKIELQSAITDKGVAIQIKDTGIGIPPDKMKNIFMLQNNKSERGTADEKGTGLGLHLVNELVKINKGLIEVLSLPKQGTTFNLLFPKVA